jgi:hypothetical protein
MEHITTLAKLPMKQQRVPKANIDVKMLKKRHSFDITRHVPSLPILRPATQQL